MSLGPLPPVPGVLKVTISGRSDVSGAHKWANVWHLTYSGGPPSVADLNTFAGLIRNEWVAGMANACPGNVHKTKVDVIDLGSLTGAEGVDTTDDGGVRSGAELPASAAVLVTYPAPIRYRGGHPRHYVLAGVAADLLTASTWTGGFLVVMNAAWPGLMNFCYGNVFGTTTIGQLCAVRYHGRFLPNSGPPAYRLVTPVVMPLTIGDAVISPQLAAQRRRIGRSRR